MSSSADSNLWPDGIYLDVRSQSEVLGVVLVFGIVLLGAFTVVALGVTAVSDTESSLSDDRAEKVLTQLDSKAGLVALGEANSQQVRFPTDASNDFSVDENDGWLRIVVENRTSEKPADWSDPELVNVTLGSISYEKGDSKLAYQGGGVFRKTDTGGMMVSPPEFHYREGTLVLPIVNITGDGGTGSSAQISQGEQRTAFPDADLDEEAINPLEDHKVNVTVQSKYYRGWGQYFEERTDGSVLYDDDAETATLELVVEANHSPVEGALVSGATQELVIKNEASMDSYDSSEGPYLVSQSQNTRVVTAGDLDIRPNSKVFGNVEVSGEVIFANNAELINGNISHGEGVGGQGWDSGWIHDPTVHWVAQNASVTPPDPVERLIDERKETLRDRNDNKEVSYIHENELEDCSSVCTLTEGSYYLENLHLDNGGILRLDTTDGEIEIAVGEDVQLDNNAIVEVDGPHRVNTFVEDDVIFNQNAVITEPNDNSTKFWLYMKTDQQAALNQNNEFVGVIYGPDNVGSGTEIILDQNAEVWGGLVGEIDFAANNLEVHYDEALTEIETVTHESKTVSITYLHVTENEIEVS